MIKEMKIGMSVAVLVAGRTDIINLTGKITEYPYCGAQFAWVEFDNPPGELNGFCFRANELVEI